jgi:hypothetical protein
MVKEEKQEVLIGNITTHQSIHLGKCVVAQVHLLSESIRGGPGWTSYKGEMNKIKPPTFDGEHKKDEDAETWLLGMRKYFQLHNYST